MNMQSLIRMAMNQLVSKGINKATQDKTGTAEGRAAAQSKRKNTQRVRQAANVLRRFMR